MSNPIVEASYPWIARQWLTDAGDQGLVVCGVFDPDWEAVVIEGARWEYPVQSFGLVQYRPRSIDGLTWWSLGRAVVWWRGTA